MPRCRAMTDRPGLVGTLGAATRQGRKAQPRRARVFDVVMVLLGVVLGYGEAVLYSPNDLRSLLLG